MDSSNTNVNEIISIDEKTQLLRKIKNLNRSKLRLKNKLNLKIKELETRLDSKWDDTWDTMEE
jgi:hypothetical protein